MTEVPAVPEVATELDRAAVDLFIKRHGREAYERGEIGETLERIDQRAEEYDPAFLSKHPELKGESITVYHDPLRGEDLAVVNTQTGEVVEVLSDELRGRLAKPPAVEVAIKHRGTEPEGIAIADELGVRYDGILEGIAELPSKMMFTDVRQTGSTFTANTLEEARTKLADMRAKFARPAAVEVTKPKRYIIKEESEPLYKSGKKYVAYYEDGTPRYLAAETEQALKTRLLEAEPNAEFVSPPAEDILDLSKGEMMEIPLDASGKAIPLEEGNPGRETDTGETLNKLLPMSPEEGPPLPRGLGLKWPWKK